MEYKNSVEAVYIQLNDILQHVAEWGSEETLRTIDIDLTLNKLRDVYDIIHSLKNEQLTQAIPSNETPAQYLKETIVEENIEENVEEVEDSESSSIEFEVEETPSAIEEPSKNLEEIKNKIKSSVKNDEGVNTLNLSEQYKATQLTLNEELSSHVSSEDLAIKLKTRPIKNLSSAIGLNEKFEFINNLFHGNKEQYEETVDTLNQATNFNEAYDFLSSKLGWDMSDPLAQRMLELIRRKLIINSNE